MFAFESGQQWTYRAPEGFEGSRIVVGAVLTFSGHEPVVCCAVTDAPSRLVDGSLARITIPFLPLSEAALRSSVVACSGRTDPPVGFAEGLAVWSKDPRGLSVFTVPFDGFLDRLIARQMAAIVGLTAA